MKRKSIRNLSHTADNDKKEVYFYIPNGMPSTLAIPSIMKQHYPEDYRALVIKSKDQYRELIS